jgi:hypothetical protein
MTLRLVSLIGIAVVVHLQSLFATPTFISTPGCRVQSTERKEGTQQEARWLWEQAIAAKGGREKLHVKNIVISSRAEYTTHQGKRNPWSQEEVFVFPDKQWHWNDMRPDVFGLRIEMRDYGAKTAYVSTPDLPEMEIRHLATDYRWEETPLLKIQLLYFLETRWVTPVPIAVHQSKVNGQTVDIVQTQVFGQRVDFALHTLTHLPVRISYYNRSITGRGPFTISNVDVSEYVEVDGIKVPQKAAPENGSAFSDKIQINVDYNEQIFLKPTTIEAGPEAWRPKK